MKTIILLLAACAATLPGRTHSTSIAEALDGNLRNTQVNNANAASQPEEELLPRSSRYSSFSRSFMPYAEDPCNHTPTVKSVC